MYTAIFYCNTIVRKECLFLLHFSMSCFSEIIRPGSVIAMIEVHTKKKKYIQYSCLQDLHCTENSKQIFPDMKLRGLVPNCIFARSVRLFCCIAFGDRSWEYSNRSQIHKCRNWERGCAISFLEIFVLNFRYSAFAL
jgi:hypothetical protein